MKTYLAVLASLEGIWFVCLVLFALYGVWMEYKTWNKRKKNITFFDCLKKIFLDKDLSEFYFVGAFIVFILSIPATWFVFIFSLFEKILK